MPTLYLAFLALLIQFSISITCDTTSFPHSNEQLTTTGNFASISQNGEVDLSSLSCETGTAAGDAAFQ